MKGEKNMYPYKSTDHISELSNQPWAICLTFELRCVGDRNFFFPSHAIPRRLWDWKAHDA